MSRTDELPHDQRAALQLLLRQRKTHAEVAELLHISKQAVHQRAHAALIALAPSEARALSAHKREQIGDYLLGQQASIAEQMRIRGELAAPGPARAWAQALVAELAPLAGGNLPELPPAVSAGAATGPSTPTPPAPAGAGPTQPGAPPHAPGPVPVAAAAGTAGPTWETATRGLPSSRLGGGLLLAILLAAIVVTIVLVSSSGSGSGGSKSKSTAATETTAGQSGLAHEGHFVLKAPEASSKSAGVVEILSKGGARALFVRAEHIPATKGFFYAIWLYNPHGSAEAVSRSPDVGKAHSFEGAVAMPGNASEFKEVLITKETSSKPTRPGHVVLRGPFEVPATAG